MNRLLPCTRCIVVLLLAVMAAACTNWFADEHKLMQKAAAYIGERDMNAAAIELRNVLQVNPDNADARYLLAGINLDYGDFASAEKEFRRAEQAGHDPQQTRIGMARCFIGLGEFRKLLDAIVPDAKWSSDTRADIRALRAVADAGLGDTLAAGQELAQALQLAPERWQVMKVRVQLALLAGQQDEARKQLERALSLYGDNPELLLLQAGLLSASGQSAAALPVYQRVIAMDSPKFITANGRTARLRMAQLQIVAGALDAAAENIRPLFRRDASDPFTNYLGGLIAFERNDYQRAEELLLNVLKLSPDHNPTRLLFGTVNFAEHNYEQAAYFLGKYIDAVPDNIAARKLLARSEILLDRPDVANTVLKGVVTEATTDAELLTLAGLSELGRGERNAGIAGLERALQASPGDLAIRIELARAYLEGGDTGLAISQLQSMLAEGGEQQQTETLLVLAHLRAGEFSAAINNVLGMITRKPGDALLEALAGSVFAASGDRVEARRHLERALKINAGLPPAMLALAQLDEVEGRLDDASVLYRQLVDRDLHSALPMLALARVAERRNDREGMLDWLQQALEYAPRDIKPRLVLAEYYLRNGEPDKAQPMVSKALDLAPREPAVLLMMGRVLISQQQYRPASQTIEQLLGIEPDSVAAHTLLGEARMHMDQLDDARRELLVAIDGEPNNLSALALLVQLEIRAKAFARAHDYGLRIQQAYPELYLGYELTADALSAAGDNATAAQQYELAWDRLPSDRLVIKRAGLAVRSNNYVAAVSYLREWLGGHPDALEVRLVLAGTLQGQGKNDAAIEQYRQVLQSAPENLVALNNLAVLYQDSDRPQALRMAEQAWRLAPTNAGVQDTYGWLLVQAGQFERGVPLLEKASRALGDVPEVRYHLAVGRVRSGDRDRGKAMLQALLAEHASFAGRSDAQRLLGEL